jgi:hypothetical protein
MCHWLRRVGKILGGVSLGPHERLSPSKMIQVTLWLLVSLAFFISASVFGLEMTPSSVLGLALRYMLAIMSRLVQSMQALPRVIISFVPALLPCQTLLHQPYHLHVVIHKSSIFSTPISYGLVFYYIRYSQFLRARLVLPRHKFQLIGISRQ